MSIQLRQQLSDVLRAIENEQGATALTDLSLYNFKDIFNGFKAKSVDDFYEQFKELMLIIKNTKPRIGILIFQFCEIWDALQRERSNIEDLEDVKIVIEKIVDHCVAEGEKDMKALIKNGLLCVENGDNILIHSHSRTVLKVLDSALKKRKKFRVILAEQEEEKTQDMIEYLQQHGIPFSVVPEYMLSHIEQDVTKVFLGSISFTSESNFITDAGTNSVVSEFHHVHVPVYMFMITKKFSLWNIEKKHQTYKVTQKTNKCDPRRTLEYERIKFSHDRMPVDLVDYIVTEEGIDKPAAFKKLFSTRFKIYKNWREKYFL